MREGWEIKKLLEVVEFQRGLTYSKNDEVDFSENMVLRSNNIDLKTNKLDFTEIRYINPKIVIPENKKVTKGSLIICTANGSKSHLGKVALIDDDYNYAFGGFMGLIKPKENLNPDFLFHLLTSEAYKKFIGALSDGANINNLKFSDLGEFEIPLPSLPEQQRIVAILDEAFAAIAKAKANAEQNLKNAKELFESYLQGVFEKKGEGWEAKNMGEVAKFSQGIQVGLEHHISEPKNGYVRFIRIIDYTQETDDIRFVPDPGQKYFVNKDDVVMVRYGSPGMIGRGKEGVIANNLFKITIEKTGLSNDFLCLCLSQKHIQSFLSTQGSATMPALNFGQLKNVLIDFPSSIEEQHSIVRQLDALRTETQRLESVYQQKLADLEELKKSILQKAFAGDLIDKSIAS